MIISKKGRLEILSHEAIVLTRYLDSVGVWTIFVGHTKMAGDPDPEKMYGVYTVGDAIRVFNQDLRKFEDRVNRYVKVPMTQNQFDALVSFDFNTGGVRYKSKRTGKWYTATWINDFIRGDMQAAEQHIMNWNKPASIIDRRRKEKILFFNNLYSNNGYVNVYRADSRGRVLWRQGRRIKPEI